MFAEEQSIATLKAEYKVIGHSVNKSTGDTIQNIQKFILQMAPNMSYYYNPQTYYVDSLENDPQGKLILEQAWATSLETFSNDNSKNAFDILEKQGFLRETRYRNLKDFNKGNMRVWDSNMGSKYRYDIEMNDLTWELGDSIKTILDFECQNAIADYHGRKWEAWFTIELPIQDGPWQLYGLPGLIIEAATDDGIYAFKLTGIQECNEPFKPTFEDKSYFITKRKSFLKMKDSSTKNRSALVNAMTNGNINLSNSINASEKDIDLIETDYH